MDRRRRGLSPPREGGPSFHARGAERLSVDESAALTHHYAIEVKVRDVSTSGFMAECADSVAIGSHVSLHVPGIGAVRAQVRWQIGSRMGGRFLDPISLDECEWTAVRTEGESLAAC
jgi:hypothetical protein